MLTEPLNARVTNRRCFNDKGWRPHSEQVVQVQADPNRREPESYQDLGPPTVIVFGDPGVLGFVDCGKVERSRLRFANAVGSRSKRRLMRNQRVFLTKDY